MIGRGASVERPGAHPTARLDDDEETELLVAER